MSKYFDTLNTKLSTANLAISAASAKLEKTENKSLLWQAEY